MAAKKNQDEFVLPGPKAKPGEVANARGLVEEKIKALNAEVKKWEGFKSQLNEMCIGLQEKVGGKVFGSDDWVVTIDREDKLVVDTVNDGWTKFYDYIKKTGDFDLLQRRLGEKAVGDRIAAGKAIPGITTFPVDKVSVKRVK